MPESVLWADLHKQGKTERNPLRALFKNRSTRYAYIIGSIGMTGYALSYWATAGFLPTLLPAYGGIKPPVSLYVMMVALVASLIGYLTIGALSDSIGLKKSIYIFLILGGVFDIPMFYVILGSFGFLAKLVASAVLLFSVTGVWGILPRYLAERYPTKVRDSGVGATFNSGFIIGAWAPVFALLLAGSNIHGLLLWSTASIVIIGLILIGVGTYLTKEAEEVDLPQ